MNWYNTRISRWWSAEAMDPALPGLDLIELGAGNIAGQATTAAAGPHPSGGCRPAARLAGCAANLFSGWLVDRGDAAARPTCCMRWAMAVVFGWSVLQRGLVACRNGAQRPGLHRRAGQLQGPRRLLGHHRGQVPLHPVRARSRTPSSGGRCDLHRAVHRPLCIVSAMRRFWRKELLYDLDCAR